MFVHCLWLSCTDLLQRSQSLLQALGLGAQTGSAVATSLVITALWWRRAAVVGAEAHNDAEVPRGVEACCNSGPGCSSVGANEADETEVRTSGGASEEGFH